MTGTELMVIVAAFALGASVKSVTGMGLPLVAVPIAALVVPTSTVVAVIAVPNAVQNLILVYRHRDARPDTAGVGAFCAVGVVGAAIGAFAITVVDDRIARGALATMLGVYLLQAVRRRDPQLDDAARRRYVAPVAFAAGVFQGGIGISGPIVAGWYRAQRVAPRAFVFSIASVFGITGITQIVVFGARDELEGGYVLAAALSVVVALTIPVGQWIRDRLDPARFQDVVIALLTLSWVSLVVDLALELPMP